MTRAPEDRFPLTGRRVYVAGHRGMVGSAVVRRLASEECEVVTVARDVVDLRRQTDVEDWMAETRPDAVILAAATVGGILANDRQPADFLYDNLMIEMNVMAAARRAGVAKLLFLGSSCIYPRLAPQPIQEDALLTGPLEPTNQWYALAKIAGVKLADAYRRQHQCDMISVMPTNLYGPNDSFDLANSHVLPAILRKVHEAKTRSEDEVVIWGTGTPRREFLYVDDLADALIFLLKTYSSSEIVNIGTGTDVTILELSEMIADVVGYQGRFVLDRTKPDGTPRKLLDVSRLSALGWQARTSLHDGLRHTYDWFLQNAE